MLPGDHPDPSIIRVGKTYWTASTSGDWSPQFPLYRSSDLHRWEAAGSIFPHQPSWAVGSFWAPELVYDHQRVLVYYVGRKREGPLCVAVATAPAPQGPYTDHGAIVCQADGSIDPAFARDEKGNPYLLWKEDGNSIDKPTPIWAQPLSSDLVHLTGEKTQLLTNDAASWEGGVVEAPYVMRHDGFFYLFYAGNGCCGVGCRYAEGVARSRTLLGPWTKDPENPIIRPNGNWRCPGHGSAVSTPKGIDYFLYHAYPVQGSVYLGRESVLDRITWATTGWPSINHGQGPAGTPAFAPAAAFHDRFMSNKLNPEWHWHVNHTPQVRVGQGRLTLTATAEQPSLLAHPLLTPNYSATVDLIGTADERGSLVVIGDGGTMIGLGRPGTDATLQLWRTSKMGVDVLWKAGQSEIGSTEVRIVSDQDGRWIAFSYRKAPTAAWQAAGEPIDVTRLPQWDEGLRIGLLARGAEGQSASFADFTLTPETR